MGPSNTIHIAAADYPIQSVVVLKSSKAEIVRSFDVPLSHGQNKLIISKLPGTIDTQSVRISGFDQKSTYLSDVVCSVSEADATADDALSEAVYALGVQKALLEQEKQVLCTQAGVLVQYANSLTGEHASPDVISEFLSDFREQGKQNILATADLDSQIRTIDKQIKEKKKQLSSRKGAANTELTAVITAGSNTSLSLKLTYIVSGTNWSPTYELHAVTNESGQPSRTVSLHYRACIKQSTGEDWTDAALTLSTVATDTVVKRVPKLDPIKIRVSPVYTNPGGGGFLNGGVKGGGLFGNQNQNQNQNQAIGGGLFGNQNQFQARGGPFGGGGGGGGSGGGGLFGNQNQTGGGGGLFGGGGGGGGLFGNQSQSQLKPTGFGAFGSSSDTNSGSWFGNTVPSVTSFGNNAASYGGNPFSNTASPFSTGLFGTTAAAPPPGPSSFGQPPPPPWYEEDSAAAPRPPLFGTPSGASAPAPTSSFGGTAAAPTGPSVFGTTSASAPTLPGCAPPGPSLFGSFPASAPAPATIPRALSPDHGVIALAEEEEDGELEDSDTIHSKPTKLVTQTPMALTYAVHGKSSIPSDGKEHIVIIAVLSFEMEIEYVSVPRVDPRVYLQCQVKNNSDYRLLSGPVSIILDDSYVSKNTIFDVNRDQYFNFTLGDDPSLSLFYCRTSETTKEGSGAFADIMHTTTFTISIHVRNKHGFPIEKLVLRDAIPVVAVENDKRVRVVLKKPKELIEAGWKEVRVMADVQPKGEGGGGGEKTEGLRVAWLREKEGLYEYKWRVGADEQVKLETVFEMKASADLNCFFDSNSFIFGKKAM